MEGRILIMNERQATKVFLKFVFKLLEEDKDMSFSKEQVENAIEAMHDDDLFFSGLLDFMETLIDNVGENYGLWDELT